MSSAVTNYGEQVEQLRQALSDPFDIRTPEEIGNEVGLSLHQVRAICKGKKFSKSVLEEFKEQLSTSSPIIFKNLIRQAQGGSTSAAKLYLEAAGFIGDGGSHLHLHNHSGESSQAAYSKMSDEELDKDISRLLREITPSDLVVNGSEVSPADFEILDADIQG